MLPQDPEDGIRVTDNCLHGLEKRDWSLWITATFVMVLLAFGLYSFTSIPERPVAPSALPDLENATRGLFGVVLLFVLFAFYKQIVLNRMRRQLAEQMKLAAALQTRAELFQKLAILDPLTGVYNRRFAAQHLPVELARAQRHHYKITALMFDLNGLKQINDRHSHLAGDLALREFANCLRRAIRSSDVAVRMGGDEFMVILPECEASAVSRVLARMNNLQAEFRGEKIPLSFAAGWAEHQDGETPEELLARADQRLYEDKRTGIAGVEARAVEEQKRQAEKMEVMGRLTSSVAHDFNNLLTIIRGYAELGCGALEETHPVRPHVEQIQKAAERATSLTGQLLAFSRKQALQPRLLDINSVLESMSMMCDRLLGDRIQLAVEPAADLHTVRADAGQIEQVIMNLLANARDAMPRGGRVRMTTANLIIDEAFAASHPGARPGEYVRIEVHDTGMGMDSATRSHIFEPFFTTKEPGKGTGLGLSTVYGMVKQNGGYVWVESEPGHGTTVSLYLPRAAAASEATAPLPETARASAAAGDGRPTILVVESFESLRNFMCESLRLAGYHPIQATHGEQAMQIVADRLTAIDLMICDVLLPGMSGLELSECLASECPNLQVLFIAGYAEDAPLYREWLQGTAHILAAPFTVDDFGQKVRELLPTKAAVALP